MAETFQLQLTKAYIEPLLNKQIGIDPFLTDLFKENGPRIQMCNALREYHRNDGGSPEVHEFEIVNTAFDHEGLKGKFRCKFTVLYHFTCSDVHNRAFDTIDWELKIDAEHAIAYFTGEEVLTANQ